MHWVSYIYAAFFLSGGCALVYQVVWARMLSISLGSTAQAVSLMLAAFMAGLAAGGFLAGRWIDRRGNPLVVFGMLELAIGGYALLLTLGLPAASPQFARLLAAGAAQQLAAYALAVLVVAAPATLMGGTFPVLAKLIGESERRAGRRVAALYASNTLGAAAGSLSAALVLIPALGVSRSALLAAGVNVTVGGAALLAGALGKAGRAKATSKQPANEEKTSGRLLALVVFYSGFATLAVEVLWTRQLATLLTGNTVIFAVILAAILTGFALAAGLITRRGGSDLSAQRLLPWVLLAGSVCVAASVLVQYPAARMFDYVHRQWPADSELVKTAACLALLYLAVTPAAAVLGAVFPLALRHAARNTQTLGGDVGRLTAINTLGAIAGATAGGFVLLPLLGLGGGLVAVAAGYGLLALVALPASRWRMATHIAIACWLLSLAAPLWREQAFWLNHGFTGVSRVAPRDTLYYREGTEATVGVARRGDILLLAVNGLVVAETSRRDLWDLLLKAHLPMLLHEEPKRVALVGLGAGVSLSAVEAYDSVERIDCVEISPEVEEAHRLFGVYNRRCWEDPRLNLHIDDGRRFLLTGGRSYDVICVDPIDPPVCNLYTQEFYELCRERLSEGGLLSQWLPLFRLSPDHLRSVMRAFVNVFPESTLWYDGTSVVLIGSRGRPLAIDAERFVRRAEQAGVRESLSTIDAPGPWLLLATGLLDKQQIERLIGDTPAHTDDYPLLEYVALYSAGSDAPSRAASLEMLRQHSEGGEFTDDSFLDEAAAERLADARGLMAEWLTARILWLRGERGAAVEHIGAAVREYQLTRRDFERLAPLLEEGIDWSEVAED